MSHTSKGGDTPPRSPLPGSSGPKASPVRPPPSSLHTAASCGVGGDDMPRHPAPRGRAGTHKVAGGSAHPAVATRTRGTWLFSPGSTHRVDRWDLAFRLGFSAKLARSSMNAAGSGSNSHTLPARVAAYSGRAPIHAPMPTNTDAGLNSIFSRARYESISQPPGDVVRHGAGANSAHSPHTQAQKRTPDTLHSHRHAPCPACTLVHMDSVTVGGGAPRSAARRSAQRARRRPPRHTLPRLLRGAEGTNCAPEVEPRVVVVRMCPHTHRCVRHAWT